MQTSNLLDRLTQELRRRGVPDGYVARLVGELADHRGDLVANLAQSGTGPAVAEIEADQRIGNPVRLAEEAAERFRRRSFVGRHRILCLLIVPLFVLPIVWTAFLLPFVLVTSVSAHFQLLRIGCWILNALVPLVSAAGLYLLSRRSACGRAWCWTPCVIIGVVWAFMFIQTGRSPRPFVGIPVVPTPSPVRLCLPILLPLVMRWVRRRPKASEGLYTNIA